MHDILLESFPQKKLELEQRYPPICSDACQDRVINELKRKSLLHRKQHGAASAVVSALPALSPNNSSLSKSSPSTDHHNNSPLEPSSYLQPSSYSILPLNSILLIFRTFIITAGTIGFWILAFTAWSLGATLRETQLPSESILSLCLPWLSCCHHHLLLLISSSSFNNTIFPPNNYSTCTPQDIFYGWPLHLIYPLETAVIPLPMFLFSASLLFPAIFTHVCVLWRHELLKERNAVILTLPKSMIRIACISLDPALLAQQVVKVIVGSSIR